MSAPILFFQSSAIAVTLPAMPITWNRPGGPLEGFEELTEDLVNTARVLVLILDPQGRVVQLNSFMEELTGYRLDEVVGRDWFETFIPEEDKARIRGVFASAIGGNPTVGNINPIITKDGRLKQIEWFDRDLRDLGGKVVGLLVVGRDLTEQIEAETGLRDSEERARAVLDTAVNAIITMDESRRIRSVNPAVETLFGYSAEDLVGENVNVLMPSPYHEAHDEYVENYLKTGVKKIIGIGREVVGRHRDGTNFPIDLSVGEARLSDGSRQFTGIIRDLSQRKRLEEKLLEISEEEQRRIGRDIHDDLCQQLAGIGCLAQVLQKRLAEGNREEAAEMAEIVHLVSDANARAREMSRGLVPVIRESGGLGSALTQLAASSSRMFGVECTFSNQPPVSVSNNKFATQVFRVAQEAVSNACRHSGAARIEICLGREGGQLVLTVTDNGSGMPEGGAAGSDGLGLLTMAHRAMMLGGQLQVQPAEGGGTVVRCSVPLRDGPNPRKSELP